MEKWQNDFNATRQTGGDDIILSSLPPTTKRKLWDIIKSRNPAKAAAMLEGLAAVRQLDPTAELILSKAEYEEYMA